MRTFCISFILSGVFLLALNCTAEDGVRRGSYAQAQELLDNGVIFEAIHELELHVEDNPDDEDAYMLLARTLQRVKRDRLTAVAAAQVLRINPDNAEARRLLTRIRIKLGRDLDRNDPVALLDYARLCARPETYDRAADFYNMYLEKNDDPLVHMEFAKMLYWAENYEEAKRHLLIYIEEKPSDNDMRVLLGNIYGTMGDFDSAVEQYRICVDANPDDVEVKLNLIRALMWSGHEEDAEVLLNEIRKRSSEFDAPLLLLATIARIQGRVEDEYNLYKSVLQTNPENKEALDRIDELESGNLLEISKLLRRLASNHEDLDARRQLIDIYLSEGRYGESIPHLEVLNSLVPTDIVIAEELRNAREIEGELAMLAVQSIRKNTMHSSNVLIKRSKSWLKDNPNDYRTRVQLVDVLINSGRFMDAIGQLEILESMTPSDKRIRETLKKARMLQASTVDEAVDNKEL